VVERSERPVEPSTTRRDGAFRVSGALPAALIERPCSRRRLQSCDRRATRVTRWAGRDSYSPAGLLGWLLLVRVLRWLFGTGCGLDADCLPGSTRSEGMPSQLPGLSTTAAGQGRRGCQSAGALGLGLDAWPAAVRTIGRWEGWPGGEPSCQRTTVSGAKPTEPLSTTRVMGGCRSGLTCGVRVTRRLGSTSAA
jgi:hypothetical protein